MDRSADDLRTPLHQVTFVVVDLETTGASPTAAAITEVGAVKLQGGERLGTFHSLVNPGVAIPQGNADLTGITEALVAPAPRIEAVLPCLLEFIGSSRSTVIVGHNVRFDLSFLQDVTTRGHYARLNHAFVDTCALARRLVGEEVPNCKLSTLADHFRLANKPIHRALDDALATGELLHCLLERAGSLGVTALDDLLALPAVRGEARLTKLRLVAALPHQPGVYILRDRGGRPLYVGSASDLHVEVRSHFTGRRDDPGPTRQQQLMRQLARIDHVETPEGLTAFAVADRLVAGLRPRFNRRTAELRRRAYIGVSARGPVPRLTVVRSATSGAASAVRLGPFETSAAARRVTEAVAAAVPVNLPARWNGSPTEVEAQPSTAAVAASRPRLAGDSLGAPEPAWADRLHVSDLVIRGLTTEPRRLLEPLSMRMLVLAAERRFEEADAIRASALVIRRAAAAWQRVESFWRAGRIVVVVDGRERVVIQAGRVAGGGAADIVPGPQLGESQSLSVTDEAAGIVAYLEAHADRIRLVECEGQWASSLCSRPLPLPTPPVLPAFEPGRYGAASWSMPSS